MSTTWNVCIRKWLKIHPSITNLSFYSPFSPCPLPLKLLITVLISAKVSGHLLLRDSNDCTVLSANPQLKVGNWKVDSASSVAEAEMVFQQIRGPCQMGRNGLGVSKLSPIPEKGTFDIRKLYLEIYWRRATLTESSSTKTAVPLDDLGKLHEIWSFMTSFIGHAT